MLGISAAGSRFASAPAKRLDIGGGQGMAMIVESLS